MRITFVIAETDMSGGIRVIADHAQRLEQRGHTVTLVSLPHRQPTFADRVRSLLGGRGWPKPKPPARSHLDGRGLNHRVLESRRPITAADVPDADVVVATWYETAEWVARLPACKGAKIHFLQGYEDQIPERRAGLDAAWRLPLHKIAVSQWLIDLARDKFGIADAALVENAVDTAEFHAPPRDRGRPPTLGVLYSRVPDKNLRVIGPVLVQARRIFPDLRLVAFGGVPVDAQVPLPDSAQFTLRPDPATMRRIYASADVWLWPSIAEGFGLPILEAMACRTPVVATPAGAAPQILAGGGGIVTPNHDPSELAQAVMRILHMSDAQWRALSDQALAIAGRYNWHRSSDLFEAALHRAAGLPQPVRSRGPGGRRDHETSSC
jgi:glycosyltransferase involved in cell wall biosynthesis